MLKPQPPSYPPKGYKQQEEFVPVPRVPDIFTKKPMEHDQAIALHKECRLELKADLLGDAPFHFRPILWTNLTSTIFHKSYGFCLVC